MGRDGFSFMKYDVTNYIHVEGPLDYVLHFASPASPIDYLEKPIQTLKVGSLGTHKTLGVAKEKKARYLIASTSEVYGDPLTHPQKEDYWGNVNPVGPRGVYDEAKRFAEAMTMAYHRFHGVETRIVRIFNTYGPRMRINDGRVVPAFISQALRNEPLTVFGDGSQTRSFCYVSDLVEGIYRLLMSDEPNPTNIGNPSEMTVLQFAEEIKRLTGTTAPIEFIQRTDDIPAGPCLVVGGDGVFEVEEDAVGVRGERLLDHLPPGGWDGEERAGGAHVTCREASLPALCAGRRRGPPLGEPSGDHRGPSSSGSPGSGPAGRAFP
jgi:dTDP-glucose 4,6-dehydratase